MGKKTPKMPTPPDPNVVAAAQTGMNVDTAVANANLNRINQYSPEGSLEFNQIGTNADGTPKYESRQTYSPSQQAIYDTQNQVSQALSGLALTNVGRVADVQGKPFNYDSMTPLQTGYGRGNIAQGYDPGGQIRRTYSAGGPVQTGYDQGGDIQRQIGDAGNVQSDYAGGGDITRGYGSGGNINYDYASGGDITRGWGDSGNIQDQLDFSKLGNIPGIGDFGAEAKRAQDAVYSQATSRLDPRFETERNQLASQLAGKGVTENSEAYRNAMDQFARQKTDAYNQATYSSIGAGGNEQSRLFGLALGARQQGAQEAQVGGQFANQAQQQRYAQGQGRAEFANTAQQQAEQQAYQRAGFSNQAQQQAEQQAAARGEFANTAQQQAEQQSAARAAFGNMAQGQIFGQQAQRGTFANTAQGQANEQARQAAEFANQGQQQNYGQQQDIAQYENQAQQQQYAQNAAQAAFGNMAQGQDFGQAAQQAAFNNNARQQQIQEATYLRNLPLNEISALMGASGGVQQPNFADFANVNVANTDYAGLVQNQFQNQMGIYQQQQAQKNAMMGQIFGLVGSGASAAMMSDRRLKTGIKQIGELANGIKTYVFSYIGQKAREFGVMADEVFKVIPSAVIIRPDGYLMVDYRKVW